MAAEDAAPGSTRTSRSALGIAGISVMTLLVIVAGFLIAYQFVDPAPPRHVVLATGVDGGAYQRFGRLYAERLARLGIEVSLRATSGARENLELLASDSGVDLAFVQGGLAEIADTDAVVAVGSLYLEPLWFFVRADAGIDTVSDLAGQSISIGAEGSGTRIVAENLLKEHGIDALTARFEDVDPDELGEAMRNGRIDAAFVVAAPDAAQARDLIEDPAIVLKSLARADAYVRRHAYLKRITLPEGVLDLLHNRPDSDVDTVALTAMLVARKDFHPALTDLLLVAATEIHGGHGMLADAGVFPNSRQVDLPLSEDAKRYFKYGPPFLMRYLPFWAATLIDRLWVMLLPLVGLAIPLIKLVPPVYQWRMRQRLLRQYAQLEQLDPRRSAVTSDADRARRIKALNELDNKAVMISVPREYKGDIYKLRRDIDLVRRQLNDGSIARE